MHMLMWEMCGCWCARKRKDLLHQEHQEDRLPVLNTPRKAAIPLFMDCKTYFSGWAAGSLESSITPIDGGYRACCGVVV